jgi:hypothetical protein
MNDKIVNDNDEQIEFHDKSRLASTAKVYFVLILIILVSFGSAFIYDNPAGLQDILKTSLDLSYSQFASFYSWYSFPNVL